VEIARAEASKPPPEIDPDQQYDLDYEDNYYNYCNTRDVYTEGLLHKFISGEISKGEQSIVRFLRQC